MKRYFDNADEGYCYSIDHFKEILKESGDSEIILWLAEREVGEDHFFCSEYGEVGLKEDNQCGRLCDGYAPINGKNGRCRHSKNTYFPSEKYTLTMIDGRFKLTKLPEK
jgi:hypothetical protein